MGTHMIKYIITGGCSFSTGYSSTGWTGALSRYAKNLNPNITMIHTGFLSQGQELIQKKVTNALIELFDAGVKADEILVVVMWSGTSRKAWYIDSQYIIEQIVSGMPNFHGGMCKQFLDFKNEIVGELGHFKTKNGTVFDYNKDGGWYFTVDGSECKLELVHQHYLLDAKINGVGKVHGSLENIIMLQNFCDLHNVSLVQQFFMDFVYQDIEKHKEHQIVKYLYKQLNFDNIIKDGMFEYIHSFMNVPREQALYISHQERLKLQGNIDYFNQDGFHPGELGAKLWCENILFPFLKEKDFL